MLKKINLFSFLVAIIFSSTFCTTKGQNTLKTIVPFNMLEKYTGINTEEYTSVFIYYPISKSGNDFSVFLNQKNLGKLNNGGRMECRLLLEGPLAITIIEGNVYHEPLTQSYNSRIITVQKGKSYYFKVTGKGELEYVFNTGKGEKNFADTKEFNAQPTAFMETENSRIPTLKTVTN